jgi:hypothetical protein
MQEKIGFGIFMFSLLGCLGGTVQHAINFKAVAQDLAPLTVKSNGQVHEGTQFWGGYAFACQSLGLLVVNVLALFHGSKEAQSGALFGTAAMFISFGIVWLIYGSTVGNPKIHQIFAMDFGFGILFIIGGILLLSSKNKNKNNNKVQ